MAVGLMASLAGPADAHPIANQMSASMAMTPEIVHGVTVKMCDSEHKKMRRGTLLTDESCTLMETQPSKAFAKIIDQDKNMT